MRDKPCQCYDCRCPLACTCDCGHDIREHVDDKKCVKEGCACEEFWSKGKGFVLGSGDPETAQVAIYLEAPGSEEISFDLETPQPDGYWADDENRRKEISTRIRDYQEISPAYFRRGAPVVSKSGGELFYWVPYLRNQSRGDFFIDNTLRCLPPREGKGENAQHYPKGNERKKAEGCCRQYDRWSQFIGRHDTVAIVSLHPAAILREPTPLKLQAKNFEKAAQCVSQGYKVIVLTGGKSTRMWLGYGENVTRWQGHFQVETEGIAERRAERLKEWSLLSTDKQAKRRSQHGTEKEKIHRARRDRGAIRKARTIDNKLGLKTERHVLKRARRSKPGDITSKAAEMRKFAMEEDVFIAPHLRTKKESDS